MTLGALVLAHFLAAMAAPWVQRSRPRRGAWWLAAVPAASSAYLLSQLGNVAEGEAIAVAVPWVPELQLSFALRLDGLGLLFALLVTGIGAAVLVYAGAYMEEDPHAGKFSGLLLAFAGAMLGLVLADDILSLYLFWELTSVFSFLLIGFHDEEAEAREAAWQALLVTVAGGLCLLAAAVLVILVAGTSSLAALPARADDIARSALAVPIVVLVLLAAFTKSAQLPFHFWLPNAMAAPTPVSAYLHSATMVNAGIYLIARLTPALGELSVWGPIITTVGALTMLLAAGLAIAQRDAKRLLAYSTASALGMMCLLLGVGSSAAVQAALALLLAHALYKGALFLFVGAVDHEAGTRRLDELSGLWRTMPLTGLAGLLAMASMVGAPPALGFVAKDALLREALEAPWLPLLLTVVTVSASVLYAGAGLITVVRPLFGRPADTPRTPHEPRFEMWGSAALLALTGVVLGVATGEVGSALVDPATRAVTRAPVHEELALWHGLEPPLFLGALALALGGALLLFVKGVWRLGARLSPWSRLGPDAGYRAAKEGLFRLARWQTRTLQSGYLPHYVLVTLATFAVLLGAPLVGVGALAPLPPRATAYELTLAVFILVSAFGAILFRSRLGTLLCMSMVGYGVALVFLAYRAPDLGITQFLVETLFVVLFVLALPRLPSFGPTRSFGRVVLPMIVAVATGVVVLIATLAALRYLPARNIPELYVEESHGHNVVNNVLVDFRALDTLGEITVLAVAGSGVMLLLRALHRRRGA